VAYSRAQTRKAQKEIPRPLVAKQAYRAKASAAHSYRRGLGNTKLQFFDDFEDFANVVNWWLADRDHEGPWRLQELPDTELKLVFSDMPDFGRRYDIFHQQVRIGTLEVSPNPRYSFENPVVRGQIEIDWVRLLSFATLTTCLHAIALHICDPDPNSREYVQASSAVTGALLHALWDAYEIDDFNLEPGFGKLELHLNGSALWYVERRYALRGQGAHMGAI
jgi:hypothetical protein